jgi:hypothetical protein
MLFLDCRLLECLLVVHLAQFGLNLLGPESCKSQEAYHRALLIGSDVHLSFFREAPVRRGLQAGSGKIPFWMSHREFFLVALE